MLIRLAQESDLKAIIELATEMVLHSVSPYRSVPAQQIRQYRFEDMQTLRDIYAAEQSGVFVAEIEGRVVGHLIVVAQQRDSSTGMAQAWIYDVSVAAGFWGKGIGQALMEQAETFARQHGMLAIGLGVTLSNQRALEFYRHQGYLEERVQMVKNLGR